MNAPTTALVPAERFTIFSPRAMGAFLEHLAQCGNVRLACRAARVSPQTAYRARRTAPGFAHAWDAALLAARHHAEEVLADRALNGWEEAVFYHGEEVATRRRFSDRLLLAHLARLDRLAERAEVCEALATLDEAIADLKDGVDREEALSALRQPRGECQSDDQDRVPCVPSRRKSLTAEDDPLPERERRLRAMEAARPEYAPSINEWPDPDLAEAMQLAAFEAGKEDWWLAGPDEPE